MNKVECYAGSAYPEQPRVLIWQGERFPVQEVLSRSREPEGLRFMVRCSPGDTLFDLYYNLIDNEWQIQPKGFVPKRGNKKQPS